MAFWSIIASLDVFHRPQSTMQLQKRVLYGHVFGTDIPAYIIFHAMLGYVLLGVGFGAIVLRLPLKTIRRRRWLHPYFGYTWIFGTIWMPVTAIWCVYTYTGWDFVAWFIFSMFAAIQLAWVSIRVFVAGRQRITQVPDDSAGEADHKVSKRLRIGKILHGVLMVYSFIMLLGAGISFPLRSNSEYSTQYKEYYANNPGARR